MEVRMQPRTESGQQCVKFNLLTYPRAHVSAHVDYLGNTIHHFDVPGRYDQLIITAEALVEINPTPPLPRALDSSAWAELDALIAAEDQWDMLMPSRFAQQSRLLRQLAHDLAVRRDADPLSVLRHVNSALYDVLDYDPKATHVDSPIDDALSDRKGVCQDYAHIMIALVRGLGIPCRYVSGYLYHRGEDHDRSANDATHAWVEALLPQLGWVGFDPTNNLLASERHIRAAIGRDYADVPPTRGIFKGSAASQLDVRVKVLPSDAPIPEEDLAFSGWSGPLPRSALMDEEILAMQIRIQQQQQQQ